MIEQIFVEWNYQPNDYFEDNFIIKSENCDIEIASGIAIARITPVHIDNIDEIISKLNQDLESCFLAFQVMTHQKYNLGNPSRYDLKKDGTRIIYAQAADIVCISNTPIIDATINDENGNVISDTKQERIDKKKWFAETAAKFMQKDQTLNQMLKSYGSAVSDPKNELVHLYEIRDAVSNKLGGKNKTKLILNITEKEWGDFGLITCRKPLLQSRHRGNFAGMLRQADFSELVTVRKIALKIIENYLGYLEKMRDYSIPNNV